MKQSFSVFSTMAVLALGGISAQATTYSDATGDGALVGTGGGILDITSVEVSKTPTDLIFKINLNGSPVATDWGKYMIGIDSVAGGDTTGNGWNRPIGMSGGMDFWLGSWADSGNGVELRNWTGAAWGLQSATYGSNLDGLSFSKDASSVTIQFAYAGLGLNAGSSFQFDVFTSGGGLTDGAVDALGNPSQTIGNWGDNYNSAGLVNTFSIPEPSALALVGLGGLALVRRSVRRK